MSQLPKYIYQIVIKIIIDMGDYTVNILSPYLILEKK